MTKKSRWPFTDNLFTQQTHTCHYSMQGLWGTVGLDLWPAPCNPINCSPTGYSVHGDSPGKNTSVGCHTLLQGIFPTQGSNPGLPHCRQILYHLSYQGSPQSNCYGSSTQNYLEKGNGSQFQHVLSSHYVHCSMSLYIPWGLLGRENCLNQGREARIHT